MKRLAVVMLAIWLALIAGCDRLDMYDQPRYEPLEASKFFADGLSARPHIEGTIARGALHDDESLATGKHGNQFVSQIPPAVYGAIYDRNLQKFSAPFDETEPSALRQALLERGRERFNIYCSVCHGRTGDGDGMIVQRGFRRPPTYHSDRLRQSADGYVFDVITTGFGAMVSYANRIEVEDRWAIVAYIRALQLSQHALLEDLSPDERAKLVLQNETAESRPKPDGGAP